MRGGIGRIGKLHRDENPVWIGGLEFLGSGDGSSHVCRTRRQLDLRAITGHDLAPLHTHAVGHGQNQPVAERRRRHRQRDAGIAAGRLDDGHISFEAPLRCGGPNHTRADAILNATSGVAGFELAVERTAGSRCDAVETDKRRVAHRLENIANGLELTHSSPSSSSSCCVRSSSSSAAGTTGLPAAVPGKGRVKPSVVPVVMGSPVSTRKPPPVVSGCSLR